MSKFTKGKWEYDDAHGCIHHDGRLIAEVAGGGGANYRHAAGQANARLIAAAPEMYELLRLAAQSLRHHSDNDYKIAYSINELLARIDGKETDNE